MILPERGLGMYTGYFLEGAKIWGPKGDTGYFIEKDTVHGPDGWTGFYITKEQVCGPGGICECWLDGRFFFGSKKELPWA